MASRKGSLFSFMADYQETDFIKRDSEGILHILPVSVWANIDKHQIPFLRRQVYQEITRMKGGRYYTKSKKNSFRRVYNGLKQKYPLLAEYLQQEMSQYKVKEKDGEEEITLFELRMKSDDDLLVCETDLFAKSISTNLSIFHFLINVKQCSKSNKSK